MLGTAVRSRPGGCYADLQGGGWALDLSADQRGRSAALLRPLELLRLPEMYKEEGNSGLIAVGRSRSGGDSMVEAWNSAWRRSSRARSLWAAMLEQGER